MTPPTDIDEAQTREQIDCKLAPTGWAIQDRTRIYRQARDKFAGKQIWNAEGSPKGQVAGKQTEQLFDEGNAFCKKITYKVGKKTAEESITNLSGTNLVALQCATKQGAPWAARNRAFRFFDKLNEFKQAA